MERLGVWLAAFTVGCVLVVSVGGCGYPEPTCEEIACFNAAGPAEPEPVLDEGQQSPSVFDDGYRLGPGELLSITMPPLGVSDTPIVTQTQQLVRRVTAGGNVLLPLVGEVRASGMTLWQLEEAIASAFHPKYMVNRPPVTVQIIERRSRRSISILGLVVAPGTYAYPMEHRISLIEALAMARGVDPLADPRWVVVYRFDKEGKVVSLPFRINASNKAHVLTDSSLATAAFAHVKPGDVLVVEHNAHTRSRVLLNRILYLNVGASAGASANALYLNEHIKSNQNGSDTSLIIP